MSSFLYIAMSISETGLMSRITCRRYSRGSVTVNHDRHGASEKQMYRYVDMLSPSALFMGRPSRRPQSISHSSKVISGHGHASGRSTERRAKMQKSL